MDKRGRSPLHQRERGEEGRGDVRRDRRVGRVREGEREDRRERGR